MMRIQKSSFSSSCSSFVFVYFLFLPSVHRRSVKIGRRRRCNIKHSTLLCLAIQNFTPYSSDSWHYLKKTAFYWNVQKKRTKPPPKWTAVNTFLLGGDAHTAWDMWSRWASPLRCAPHASCIHGLATEYLTAQVFQMKRMQFANSAITRNSELFPV